MAELQVSPPFPEDTATSSQLYNYMQDVRDWLNALQAAIRPRVVERIQVVIGEYPELPTACQWESVGVCDKYQVFVRMRAYRTYWDSIMRAYECTWDSRVAVRIKFDLAVRVRAFLNDAFVLPEHREVDQRERSDAWRKRVQAWVSETEGGVADGGSVNDAVNKLNLLDDSDFFSE